MKHIGIRRAFAYILLITAITTTNAQNVDYIAVGFKGGLGISNLNGIDKYGDRIPGTSIIEPGYKSTVYPALDLGVAAQIMYTNNLLLQGEFAFSSTGAFINKSEYVESIYGFFTTLYTYAGTKIPINDDFRFVFGAGPYIGYDITAWLSTNDYGRNSSDKYPAEGILEMSAADYKDYDIGITGMAGIEYRNWQFVFNYNRGLTNIVNDVHRLQTRRYKLGIVYFM